MTRIPEAEQRAGQYPFEFSGGMLQRAMIAMAIACEPAILVADEPSTALDVTIQAQILDLLGDLQAKTSMAIILITHDLGVVARLADEVAVMYAGRIVEHGTADAVFHQSGHPYTQGLKAAMPTRNSRRDDPLQPIDGSPPDLFAPPPGCAYRPRCPNAMRICERRDPPAFPLEPSDASRPSSAVDVVANTSQGDAASGSQAPAPRTPPEEPDVHPAKDAMGTPPHRDHFSRCWLHQSEARAHFAAAAAGDGDPP